MNMNTRGWNRREVLSGALRAAEGVAIFQAMGASCTAAFAKTTHQESANSSDSEAERTGSLENLGTAKVNRVKSGELCKPGDSVAISGIYEAIHDKLDGGDHSQPHPVIALSGKQFPACRVCVDQVRFRLLQAADLVDAHNHFKA